METKLIRVADDMIINLATVHTVTRNNGKLWITQSGMEGDPFSVEGKEVDELWHYFTSLVVNRPQEVEH